MLTRIVMVEFYPEVTPQQVDEFAGWLRDLASRIPSIKRMTWSKHVPAPSEVTAPNLNAPNAVYGNFVSLWEFEDEQGIEDFLANPDHRKFAAEKFKLLVKRRFVINMQQPA